MTASEPTVTRALGAYEEPDMEGTRWSPVRDLVWVLSPFGEPSPKIVVGAVRAGGTGLLDLGTDGMAARQALDDITRRAHGPFGVRVPASCPLGVEALPLAVDTVVLSGTTRLSELSGWRRTQVSGTGPRGAGQGVSGRAGSVARRVIAEVRSVAEAREALMAGADGLVAKGVEAGGAVGDVGAYVLSQQVLRLTDKPVWVMGGIGPHTAAAAVTGGAAGVVVDSQTALLNEANLPRQVRAAIAAMDGSETRIVAGHRIYTRPDLWVARLGDDATGEEIVPRLGATDLRHDALPAGQDAALASGFADRYGTVGRMVSNLRSEIEEHLRAAQRATPLAPGKGICATTGTTYPVVQGPMTRVSDRAAFAQSVAGAGGLPFLALALMGGDEVRPLLEETARLVGDRPWGVGVLGFVPKELREAQLAVINEVHPPFALIAGGRPAHAVGLEEAGTRTFLHVPAPGLLERFLRDGARRFVFEGFECGGHVGPRSSFTLWESQTEVLLEFGRSGGRLDELDILFAGGIHDERSAAMVAALAGPLAEAGANVGVLMGTAYLFTEEAVAAGAIGEEFQVRALDCERTALLESGPGHVTRCAESPFVEMFERRRQELDESGADPEVRWAELESLNLGRLRVASKGLKREGDELATVDRDTQAREGMFMIGDVATLLDERTTASELHEAVSSGATAWLEREAAATVPHDEPGRSQPAPVDVAIVGMACAMPGAADLDDFWRNIVGGVNSITEVPPERWDSDIYFDPEWDHATASSREGSASKWGGFLPDIGFDALGHGIPPSSLAAIEPSQLLALKVAADALADAGYATRPFSRERTSVIFGAEGGTDQSVAHGFRALFPSYLGKLPGELEEWLPKITEDSFPGLLPNVIAGRVANRLDLGGRNMTVDAACASSLAALDVACAELASGRSDAVLAGGVDLHNGIQDYLLFTSVHALSTTGQCRTFDAAADGISLGEGVACVMLKRVADAERDGDRIYAVIKSVAASSDGRSLGLTAPRPLGQERALRRAYSQAGVDPRDVGLLEAHGTGTVVGDRTELTTLTEVFADSGVAPGSCVVGSVKSNIGHTKCAAGLAGLVKAAKSVYHGVLPPTLHVDQPNQGWDPVDSPFVFLEAARPWPSERRVAGVSAFGFGGTNFHSVVQSHTDGSPRRGLAAWPAELFVFRGAPEQVDKAMSGLDERLSRAAHSSSMSPRLRDVAAAVSCSSTRGPVRVAIAADDLDDLQAKIGRARQGQSAPGVYLAPGDTAPAEPTGGDQAPKVAFLFPGQGSQRPGMAADLFTTFGETQRLLGLAASHVVAGGRSLAETMFPPAAFGDDAQEAQHRDLTETRVDQPALGLANLATVDVLGRFGVRPDMVGGHSYGELVALCVAGAFDERTLLDLSAARAEAMLAAGGDDPGGMVAVAATPDKVEALVDGTGVVVANVNHPEQLVLAGASEDLELVAGRLKQAGLATKRLPVACAFHSPVVAGAAAQMREHLVGVDIQAPEIRVFSNLTADTYPPDPGDVRSLLAGQISNGVRFAEEVEAMYDAGARVFVEAGPGRVLTGCVERILGDRSHVAVAVDRPGQDGVRSLLHALAQLAVAGVPVDVAELFEDRGVEPTRWTEPATPGWVVNGHLVRTSAGDVVPGGLRPANSIPAGATAGADTGPARSVSASMAALPAPRGAGGSNGAAGAAGSSNGGLAPDGAPADQVLAEYFRTAHQIIESGHALLLDYLGVQPTGPTVAHAVANRRHDVAASPEPGDVPAGVPIDSAPAGPSGDPAPGNGEVSGQASEGVGSVAENMGTPEELLARLTTIVALRTGYPEDVLDPELDVEADLSIDSIKRLEILSELADQIGMSDDGALAELEHLVEELAARKTLRGIVEFLFEHAPGSGAAVATEDPAIGDADGNTVGDTGAPTGDSPASTPAATASPIDPAIPETARRFGVALADAPLPEPVANPVSAPAMRVTGDGPLADALETELLARGVRATRGATSPGADASSPSQPPDAPAERDLIVVTDLFDGVRLPELYRRLRDWLLGTTCDVVVVAPLGGGLGIDPTPLPPSANGNGSGSGESGALPAGAGVRGLVKTAQLELPDRQVRLVDLDGTREAGQLAPTLADELLHGDGTVEVGWRDGQRRTSTIVPLARVDDAGELPLTTESVVLLTGGARGITARVAVALAQRSGCQLHLVGRSPWPDGEEDPELAACPDRMALRAALVLKAGRESGKVEPRAIESECDRILAAREMRQVSADLSAAGSAFTYHQLDVRDSSAVVAMVEDIYARHGRLDGLVHGAGILDDRLIADKSPEAFERVFSTKVDSALTLLAAIRAATAGRGCPSPAFVVLFGSIAGACGNRGQADYAAANDALDLLAAASSDVASRVLAVDWGPWSTAAGMVSESLARLFEDSGMGLIDPDDGTAVLLEELAVAGSEAPSPGRPPWSSTSQLIVARCAPHLLSAASGATQGVTPDEVAAPNESSVR